MERTTRRQLHADLTRLAEGDRSAFHAVYSAAWPIVKRFTERLLPDPAEAEDVAQAALLKVFSRATQYDPDRDALVWILTLARYEALTVRKRRTRRREAPVESAGERPDPRPDPEANAIQANLVAAVRLALDELSEQDVETVLTAMTDGDRGDIAAATFRKRLQRALARLSGVWKKRHG